MSRAVNCCDAMMVVDDPEEYELGGDIGCNSCTPDADCVLKVEVVCMGVKS